MESRGGRREEGESLGGTRGGEEGGRRGLEGAELGEPGQRSSSGPPAGHLKEDEEGGETQEKMRGARILPWDGAGHSAAVPLQNSEPPELVTLINISAHFLTRAARLTLQRDPRCRSGGFVPAEPPPAPRCSPRWLRGQGRASPEQKSAIPGPFLPDPSVHRTQPRSATCAARGCFSHGKNIVSDEETGQ